MSGSVVVASPNAPRPDDPLIREVADTLYRIARNYDREGSGPGSRLEGRLLEDAQAERVVREVREAIAASLRSLFPPDFLARHGLKLGAGAREILCAAAAEVEGPGAPGCGQHPGPVEDIPVRPKVSRRGTGQQEASDG